MQSFTNKKGCPCEAASLCRRVLLCDYNHNSENHYNGHSETGQRCDDQIPVNRVDLSSVDCFHSQL